MEEVSPPCHSTDHEVLVRNRRKFCDWQSENLDKLFTAGRKDSIRHECSCRPHAVLLHSKRTEISERHSVSKSENTNIFPSNSKSFSWRSSDSARRMGHRRTCSMQIKKPHREVWIPNKSDDAGVAGEVKANKYLQLQAHEHRKIREQCNQNNENDLKYHNDTHVKKLSSIEIDNCMNAVCNKRLHPNQCKCQSKHFKGLSKEKVKVDKKLNAHLSVKDVLKNGLDYNEIHPVQPNSVRILEWMKASAMLESCENKSEKSEGEMGDCSKESHQQKSQFAKIDKRKTKIKTNDDINSKNSSSVLMQSNVSTTNLQTCESKKNRGSNNMLAQDKKKCGIDHRKNDPMFLEPGSSDGDISEKSVCSDIANTSVKEINFSDNTIEWYSDSSDECFSCNLTNQELKENITVIQSHCVLHCGRPVNRNMQVCSNHPTWNSAASSGFRLNPPLSVKSALKGVRKNEVCDTASQTCEFKQHKSPNDTLPLNKKEIGTDQRYNDRTCLELGFSDSDLSEKSMSNDTTNVSVKEDNFSDETIEWHSDSSVGCLGFHLTNRDQKENVRVTQPQCVLNYGRTVNGNFQICSTHQTTGASNSDNLNATLSVSAAPKGVPQYKRTNKGNYQICMNHCTRQPTAMNVTSRPLLSVGGTQCKCFSQCDRTVNGNCQLRDKFYTWRAKNAIMEPVLSYVTQHEKRTNAYCQLCDCESSWQPITAAKGIFHQ